MSTALKKYRRLEGMGLWSGAREDQRREVAVSFGDSTLVITDSRSMTVLSHWSLAAIERLNPGQMPALYSPDGAAEEVLELDDDLLIDAIGQVNDALAPKLTTWERLRLPIMAGVTVLLLTLGAVLVPPALVDHTAEVVPMAKRVEISDRVVADLHQSGAQSCQGNLGSAALASLQRRLFERPARLVVMRGLPTQAPRIQHFPGRLFVIDARLLDMADSPDALAGALVLAGARQLTDDPLPPLLRHAGVVATFRLLMSGEFRADGARGYGQAALSAPLVLPDAASVTERFERLSFDADAVLRNPVPLDPAVRDLSGVLQALAARPEAAAPVLNDGQWVSLLNICDL